MREIAERRRARKVQYKVKPSAVSSLFFASLRLARTIIFHLYRMRENITQPFENELSNIHVLFLIYVTLKSIGGGDGVHNSCADSICAELLGCLKERK